MEVIFRLEKGSTKSGLITVTCVRLKSLRGGFDGGFSARIGRRLERQSHSQNVAQAALPYDYQVSRPLNSASPDAHAFVIS